MDLTMLFIAIGLLVSLLLLYERKKKWNTDKLRWQITGSLFTIGLLGITFGNGKDLGYSFSFLCIPLIYNWFGRWFKKISIKKLGRDFYLYLHHSTEIDESWWPKNPHVKSLDKIFSIVLVFIIFGLIISGVLAYRYIY